MAKKRPVQNPPQPPSSEDDDDDSCEEDEETMLLDETVVKSGDDDMPTHDNNEEAEEEDDEDDEEEDEEEEAEDDGKDKTPIKDPVAVQQDISDSESEPCSPPSPPSPSLCQFSVKPIVAKPVESKPKKAEKKQKIKSLDKVTTAAPTTTPPVTSVVEDPKKSLGSAKLWNEEDETAVLKGMTTFKSEKGFDPFTDVGAFHDFIKGSLVVAVTKNQLGDKMRRLRKKYNTNVEKGRGEDPVFTKPHEQTSFDLSKKIWGPKANSENSNTTTDSVNANANANANAKAGNKRKAKTNVSVNGGTEVANAKAGNEVAGVANVLALPIKEPNAVSSVGVSAKKQKTASKKEVPANGEVNETLKMKEKEDEVVEDDQPVVSSDHSITSFGLKDVKLEEMLLDTLNKTENDKVIELNKKWSTFQMDELKLFIRKTELLKETAMLKVDDMKKP